VADQKFAAFCIRRLFRIFKQSIRKASVNGNARRSYFKHREFGTLVYLLRREIMITKSKLTFVAAAFALTFSAPAFAQAVDHTGTLQPAYYDGTGKQIVGSWAPSSRSAKPTVEARPLYNSAVTPSAFSGSVCGYDPSIGTQR
jgi:hypothetical protein